MFHVIPAIWSFVSEAVAGTGSAITSALGYNHRQKKVTEKTIKSHREIAHTNANTQHVFEDKRQALRVQELKVQVLENARNHEFQAQLQQQLAEQHQRAIDPQDRTSAFQCYLQRNSQEFQLELQNLSHEHQRKIQEFVAQVQMTIADKTIDANKWIAQQQMNLQRELVEAQKQLKLYELEYQRDTQLLIAAQQRVSSLTTVQEQRRLQTSPIWMVAADILEKSNVLGKPSLHIFLSPPIPRFDNSASVAVVAQEAAARGFPNVELSLSNRLRDFINLYKNQGRSVEYKGGAWVTAQYHSESAIDALFSGLKTIPVMVLESEIDGRYLNFRTAYWDANWPNYDYRSVLSQVPYQEILFESVKARARQWPEMRAKLIAAGESEQNADLVGKFYYIPNLELLQREERLKNAGLDTNTVHLNYVLNDKDRESLVDFLVLYHCVYTGLAIDSHFLLNDNLPPLLPMLLPELLKGLDDPAHVNQLMESVMSCYTTAYELLLQDRAVLVPDLALELATHLTFLPNKKFAIQQIIYSIKAWLSGQGLPTFDDLPSLLKELDAVLMTSDVAYVDKLNACLAKSGQTQLLNVADACYRRGVNRLNAQEALIAIGDFDQAIMLRVDWAEAYYHRGLAYLRLNKPSQAVADFAQAAQLKPDWSEAYYERGNAHYRLGQHELAIANYQQAMTLNPQFALAAQQLAIVQGVWEEVKRQAEEAERKRQAEEAERKRRQVLSPVDIHGWSADKIGERQRAVSELLGLNAPLEPFWYNLKSGGQGPKMMIIPPGKYKMGGIGHSDEQPIHEVTIAYPFAMGKYPITFADYDRYCEVTGKSKPSDEGWGRGNRPVINVNWQEANAYCQWLSVETGHEYRLPSEAEWEYAARGGEGEDCWPNGLGHYAWCSDNSGGKTHPVGEKAANPFGLQDVLGNVWEWCQDGYSDNYNDAPRDGSLSENDYNNKILRGCSWDTHSGGCRLAYRGDGGAASRSYDCGFRVCCISAWTL